MSLRTAQWKTDQQFNAVFVGSSPVFNNIEVVGSGSSAKLQLEEEDPNNDNIPFTDLADYTPSDESKITIFDGKAQLVSQAGANTEFQFATPANYTYDTDEVEVLSGIAKLKDQTTNYRSTYGATMFASFEDDENLNWADGSDTGTLVGGASVSGGYIDLTGESGKEWRCTCGGGNLDAFSDNGKRGTIRFIYQPDFNTPPPNPQNVFEVSSSGNKNAIILQHTSSYFRLYLYDSTGAQINQLFFPGAMNQGQDYEIEIDIDCTAVTGRTRVFLDGVSLGNLNSAGHNRTNEYIGTWYWARGGSDNFKIGALLCFDDVQHTSGYTPDWSNVPEYQYVKTNPSIVNNNGISFLSGLSLFQETATKTNSEIKYHVSSDDGVTWKYWDGGAWSITDDSYSQANTESDVNTNIGTLAGSGTFKFRALLHSDNGKGNPELDSILVQSSQSYPLDDNLYIDTKDSSQIAPVSVTEWDSTTVTETLLENTDIKFLISVDGRATWMGWNGSNWQTVVDNTLRANANTSTEITNNISKLSTGNGTFDIRVFLYTSDNSITPTVDNVNVISTYGYKSSGSYISTQYVPWERTGGLHIESISYSINIPNGTSCTIQADFLQTNILDPRNSNYITYSNGEDIDIYDARWIQWKVDMTSSGANTPEVNWVEIYFNTLLTIVKNNESNLSSILDDETNIINAINASESNLSGIITQTESDIRGEDDDTLKTLSDQIDNFQKPVVKFTS